MKHINPPQCGVGWRGFITYQAPSLKQSQSNIWFWRPFEASESAIAKSWDLLISKLKIHFFCFRFKCSKLKGSYLEIRSSFYILIRLNTKKYPQQYFWGNASLLSFANCLSTPCAISIPHWTIVTIIISCCVSYCIFTRIGMKKKPQDGLKDFLLINFADVPTATPQGWIYFRNLNYIFNNIIQSWAPTFWKIFTLFVPMPW